MAPSTAYGSPSWPYMYIYLYFNQFYLFYMPRLGPFWHTHTHTKTMMSIDKCPLCTAIIINERNFGSTKQKIQNIAHWINHKYVLKMNFYLHYPLAGILQRKYNNFILFDFFSGSDFINLLLERTLRSFTSPSFKQKLCHILFNFITFTCNW